MFAFYLTSKDSGVDSDMTLGYFDKEKFTGEMNWNDVKFKYMFGVQMDEDLPTSCEAEEEEERLQL